MGFRLNVNANDKLVGIGYTDPKPIVTKFIPLMPHIPLITNLVLVCGADVWFFTGIFLKQEKPRKKTKKPRKT